MKRCPKTNCKRQAQIHSTYGVLPCKYHQKKDAEKAIKMRNHPFFLHPAQAARIQEQRDKHEGDIAQPWLPNGNVNEAFVKTNARDVVENYISKTELEKL